MTEEEKHRERERQRYWADPEKMRERKRVQRSSDESRAKAREYMRKWSHENAEKRREYMRQWRLKQQPEKVREEKRRWYRKWRNADPVKARETRREAAKRWREANPEASRTSVRNYRARDLAAPGTHTTEDIAALFKRQRGKCATCKAKITKTGKSIYHVDHVTPLAKGGSNWPDNLQLLCGPCNFRKNAMHPDEWASRHGMLFC